MNDGVLTGAPLRAKRFGFRVACAPRPM